MSRHTYRDVRHKEAPEYGKARRRRNLLEVLEILEAVEVLASKDPFRHDPIFPSGLAKARADGISFRLKLKWLLEDDSQMEVVWTQTSHPQEDSIVGFQPVSVDAVKAHEDIGGTIHCGQNYAANVRGFKPT